MRLNPHHPILSQYVCLETNNVDAVSEKISWTRSHRIDLVSCHDVGFSKLSYVRLGESSFGYLAAHAGFRDRIAATESATCVLIAFEGIGEHFVAGEHLPLNCERAAIHSSGRAVEVITSGYSEILSISIKQSAIVGELEKCLGRTIRTPIEFEPSLDMTTIGGTMLKRRAVRLIQLLDQTAGTRHEFLSVRQMERSLISHLVESHRHNYTRLLRRSQRVGPWQVRAAEDFIRANAAMPLSLGDVASIVGVSARSLQYSFRLHRGVCPMKFLRETRLDYVRKELLSPDMPKTVTEVAARWGFSHFGRFAAEYRERYGEMPSATLRRCK